MTAESWFAERTEPELELALVPQQLALMQQQKYPREPFVAAYLAEQARSVVFAEPVWPAQLV